MPRAIIEFKLINLPARAGLSAGTVADALHHVLHAHRTQPVLLRYLEQGILYVQEVVTLQEKYSYIFT